MDRAPTEFLKTNALLAQVFGHTLSHFVENLRQIMMGLFKAIAVGLRQTLERINTQQHAGALTAELDSGIAEYKSVYARTIVKVVDRIEAYATRNVFKLDDGLVDEGYFRLRPFAQVDFSAPSPDDEIAALERELATEIANVQSTRAQIAAIDRDLAAVTRLADTMTTPDLPDFEPTVQRLKTQIQKLQTAPVPDRGVDETYLQGVLWSIQK